MLFNPMGLPRALIQLLMSNDQPRYTVEPSRKGENRGKGKGGVPSLLVLHRSIRSYNRPERPRHWHNPADPIQAARIEAAREKRERKEKKRYIDAYEMFQRNRAHAPRHLCPNRLNPFNVVRS